jgi:hypothetical protein
MLYNALGCSSVAPVQFVAGRGFFYPGLFYRLALDGGLKVGAARIGKSCGFKNEATLPILAILKFLTEGILEKLTYVRVEVTLERIDNLTLFRRQGYGYGKYFARVRLFHSWLLLFDYDSRQVSSMPETVSVVNNNV